MINLKFYMYFNGERIRTLDDLRENFIAEDVLESYSTGQLVKWLRAWRHKDELKQVEAITSTSAREILAELIKIFTPDVEAGEIDAALNLHDYLEKRKKSREQDMTHRKDDFESLQQDLTDTQAELERFKRSQDQPIMASIPPGHSMAWINMARSGIHCRIKYVGNCSDILDVKSIDSLYDICTIDEAVIRAAIFNGLSVRVKGSFLHGQLYFYYEEV